ncbi:MAG: enoyl-CoA hydratase-related protein [Sphingobium sp.]
MSEALAIGEVKDGIGRLTLNDPARLNALSMDMVEQALAALDRIEAETRVLVVTGAGKGFCSGANLAGGSGAGEDDVDGGASLISHFNPFIRRMRQSKVPIITAVRGAAAGFGASLAMSGDLIVASENAFFLQAFRNVGLVPDGGSASFLVRSIGRARAAELMLLGERLPAAKALDWGLITRVVPDAELEATVDALARNLAGGPTIALGRIRQMAWSAAESDFDAELAIEVDNQRECVKSADHKEGVAAFLEKRAPVFTGK